MCSLLRQTQWHPWRQRTTPNVAGVNPPLVEYLATYTDGDKLFDLSFNIKPIGHANGFPWKWVWLDFGCLAFMGGFLGWAFLKNFNRHAPFPQRDPRLLEAMGVNYVAHGEISGVAPTTGGHE